MKRNDRIFLSLVLTFIIAVSYVSFCDFYLKCKEVREETLRLHILANSDDEEDQRIKLMVRDEILKEYGDIMASCKNREDAERKLGLLKDDIKAAAIKKLREQGKNYDVKVSLKNMYFDSRFYSENITLPAGNYDALRIEIGEGRGHNWWCVMYPPLCIPVYCERDAVVLTEKIESLNDTGSFHAKLAFLEIGQKIAERLRNR